METIHYIFAVLAVIGAFAAHYLSTREQQIYVSITSLETRIDKIEKVDHEQFKQCIDLIKEINTKLDDIKDTLSQHAIANSALTTEVDNIKEKVGRLEAWFGAVIEDRK